LSRFDIQADLPGLKKAEDTKWLKEVNSQSLQASLENLDRAYKAFFKQHKGFPKFKNKHKSKQSYSIPQHSDVDFEKCLLIVPKMKPISIRFHRDFEGKIKTITIKKTTTNKYFASILVETKDVVKKPKAIKESTTIGLDLGIKDFAVLSTGEKIANPKTLKQYEHKLKKAQQQVSRKTKGGKNREKAKLKIAKVHEKIANVRKDFLHKLSYRLTHESQVNSIVIEDLNVLGMVKNHKLAKSISDCSWSEFVRQLEYKSEWYGKNLITIGRFEPSSKLCSNCGTINQDLTLKDREWTCKSCGSIHDRDINASINIKNIGLDNRNKIPTERRKSTLAESRCNNAAH
jgi:putative transposase